MNKIYGYNLASVSAEISGNFMAVDLIDWEHRICYQVTSRNDRKKIIETIEKFNKSNLKNDIDELNIFIIGTKKNYEEPLEIGLINGNRFSLAKNVLDITDLLELIQKKENSKVGFIADIYKDINMIFDSGTLSIKSIVKRTDELLEFYESENGENKIWKMGFGDVQIIAFIPLSYEKEVSCLLLIRESTVSGSLITFSQDMLLKRYFVSEEEFKERHCVGRYKDDELMYMQIENIRIQVNANTGYHIYKLFDMLKEEYFKEQKNIERILGVEKFKKVGSAYYLTSISVKQWDEIYCFALDNQSHFETGEVEWNIFRTGWINDHLVFAKNSLTRTHADVFAQIDVQVSKAKEDMVDVFWRPGYVYRRNSMEGFDNVIKWKADYCEKWIVEKLIPKAHKYCLLKKLKNFGVKFVINILVVKKECLC